MSQVAGYEVQATPQSRNGHHFVGPGEERYANKGKVVMRALDETSRNVTTAFNVAEGVSQALASVAESNDAGNMLIFDQAESVIIRADSPEAARIRRAIADAAKKTRIHRRKNTFFVPLWIQEDHSSKTPFQGQGA